MPEDAPAPDNGESWAGSRPADQQPHRPKPFREQEDVDPPARITGDDRVVVDPPAARALVHTCGLLPLAVLIAVSRPGRTGCWPFPRRRA
ncbi:hypothetical protein ACH4E7_39250 [Kitasatospora sp. NPDC018058]|uniref:hypothetical protein n=1 Tax=Kitasatospora sp. NPDC018058 TaxID=3364025 RepID=UPI0037BFD1AB